MPYIILIYSTPHKCSGNGEAKAEGRNDVAVNGMGLGPGVPNEEVLAASRPERRRF